MVKQKVLLVGMYDERLVSMGPKILKAYAEQAPISNKFDIKTIDLSIFSQNTTDHTEAIRSHSPDIVGFSSYVWNMPLIEKIVPNLDTTIILGGPQCTTLEKEILDNNPGVDYVVTGEGVITFKELLEHFAKERKFEDILGVTSRKIHNPPRPIIQNLDEIPSPYKTIAKECPDLEWIVYETSKGCPQRCKYCTWANSRRMRYHSDERVEKDLEIILNLPNLKSLYLGDSSILHNKKRAKRILNFIHNNSDVSVRYEFNATQLDDDIIGYLTKLSGDEYNFGLQTINPIAAKIMNRPFRREKFEERYKALVDKAESPSITIDIIYGLPGDDYEGYKKSLDYALGLDKVNWILTNPLILLPGSEFSERKDEYGIKLADNKSYVISSTTSFSEEDMKKAKRISYLTAMTLLNKPFKEAMKRESQINGKLYTDMTQQFFDGLEFRIVPNEYPHMIPTTKHDFEERNLALYHTFNLFPQIIKEFNRFSNNRFSESLSNYKQEFIPKFYSYKKFALEDVKKFKLKTYSVTTI